MKCLILMPLLFLVVACSGGEDTVKNLLPDPPPIDVPDNGDLDVTPQSLEPQTVSQDVPELQGAQYLGKMQLKVGEPLAVKFKTQDGPVYFDFEMMPQEDAQYSFADFFQQMTKACPESLGETFWMEVTGDGVIVNEESLSYFDSFTAEKSKRYIMRHVYSNANACESITMIFEIKKQ